MNFVFSPILHEMQVEILSQNGFDFKEETFFPLEFVISGLEQNPTLYYQALGRGFPSKD